jgi:hypothetical protein
MAVQRLPIGQPIKFGISGRVGTMTCVVVVTLRTGRGPMTGKTEFRILGFEFGASGPTVMWLKCFLAEALVIRIL